MKPGRARWSTRRTRASRATSTPRSSGTSATWSRGSPRPTTSAQRALRRATAPTRRRSSRTPRWRAGSTTGSKVTLWSVDADAALPAEDDLADARHPRREHPRDQAGRGRRLRRARRRRRRSTSAPCSSRGGPAGPVMMKYDRREMFYHFRGRHKQYMDLKIGVKKDGTITAVQFAHPARRRRLHVLRRDHRLLRRARWSRRCTRSRTTSTTATAMYTNLPACGAFRGHGVPQPRFAFESHAGHDRRGPRPRPVRDPAAATPWTPNTRTCNALDISSCEFTATLEQARERLRLGGEEGAPAAGQGDRRRLRRLRLRAPATRSTGPISRTPTRMIRVHEDGRAVSLHIAAAEIGQGSDTVLCQIAAEELGIPYEWVWMVECDSVLAPVDLGSYSSRVTLMAGNAVKMAAARGQGAGPRGRRQAPRLRSRARSPAARGGSSCAEHPDVGMDWAEAARARLLREAGRWSAPARTARRSTWAASSRAARSAPRRPTASPPSVAEVTVDLETGLRHGGSLSSTSATRAR